MTLRVDVITVDSPSDQEPDNPPTTKDDDDIENANAVDPARVWQLIGGGGSIVVGHLWIRP